MRLVLCLALVLVLGACAPGTPFPFDSGGIWPAIEAAAPVVLPPVDEGLPPVTLDPILPAPPDDGGAPPDDDDGVVVVCRELVLPPTAAVSRITKCPRSPAVLTRR
jgi:hypothetical protein